ncbi:MAG: hypothetical protein FGF48_06195 [Candidatus Brockarchaeota archaeon]|nr:hypothetical protein [Candidatus Brockarchaeota archaeon]
MRHAGKTLTIIVVISLTMASSTLPAKPQLNYLVGLNMEVVFMDNGVARVTLKQHPFDAAGRSLISNTEVVERVIGEEDSIISLVLLFFTTDPSKASYVVHAHSKLDPEEQVLCNTGTPGVMERFDGAVTLTLDILLNTTSSLIPLGGDVYQIVVTDYFTLTDPRSWLDVMDFRFMGSVRLLNFSLDPSWAKPPSVATPARLQWLNMNEADAPDNYVLTLQIPGVILSTTPLRLRAEVSGARFSNATSSLQVGVRNTGGDEGVFTVVLLEEGFEQARKISLKPGAEAWVRFPVHAPDGGELVVKVFGGGEQLDEQRLTVNVEKSTETRLPLLSAIGLILMVIGGFTILLYLDERLKRLQSP